MRRSIALLVMLALGFTSLAVVVPGGSALGANLPDGDWPSCTERPQYCVEYATVNGTSVLNDPMWQAFAAGLTGDNGISFFNWAIYKQIEGYSYGNIPAAEAGMYYMTIKVNMGSLVPGMANTYADNAQVTLGGNASTGYTVAVEGAPGPVNWAPGADISAPNSQATIDELAFAGSVNDMRSYPADVRPLYDHSWTASNVQFASEPILDGIWKEDAYEAWWQISLENPHLTKSGQIATGYYGYYMPAAAVASMGTTAEQAATYGLRITSTKTDPATGDKVTTVVPAAIQAQSNGDLYFRVPQITFSAPRLKVRAGRGRQTVLPPDLPKRPKVAPLADAAVVSFGKPFFGGGARITAYDISCSDGSTLVEPQVRYPVAVKIEGLTNDVAWDCRIRARNSAKVGDWTYAVSATPQAGLPPLAPGAPPKVRAEVGRRNSVALTWMVPLSDGGTDLTGYKVRIAKATRPNRTLWSASFDADDRAARVAAGRLSAGRYIATVAAGNGIGYGAAAQTTFRID